MNEQIKIDQGENYTLLHTGSLASWKDLYGQFGSAPEPVRGKYFLKKNLGVEGLEISINSFPPGREMPFLHRHHQNEELYIVLSGMTQFYVDGQIHEMKEGSFIRLAPQAVRSFKNHGTQPLIFMVVQFPHNSAVKDDIKDGERVAGSVNWPK